MLQGTANARQAQHTFAFWQDNSKEFPLLSEVARRVLCISASSALMPLPLTVFCSLSGTGLPG